MALGDARFQKNSMTNKPTVYGLEFVNLNEDTLLKSKLRFSMWQKMLKISIADDFEVGENNSIKWNNTGETSIYLNPTKATMLMDILNGFLLDRDTNDGYGISSGKGFITINKGTVFGKDSIDGILRIVQFNDIDHTAISRESAYQFKKNNSYVSQVDEAGKFVPVDNIDSSNIELRLVISQLHEYINAMTMATAYSVVEQENYISSKM